jgi:protein-S-isoprenylcysteine O-methyltransferase Ste14
MDLVGSGHKIALFTLPFAVAAVLVDLAHPEFFGEGIPPPALRIAWAGVLVAGLVTWGWSVALILIKVPRGELITTGPYAVVKHPLYTGVALLVLPAAGFLFGTGLWAFVGAVLYIGSRLFAVEEEAELAAHFRERWECYCHSVWIPCL